VYHHQYDAILFFLPVLIGGLCFDGTVRVGMWLTAPLLAIILLLPIGTAQVMLGNHFGMTGVAMVKLVFPIAFTLALIGCLLLIRTPKTETGR
jgi:hypothetical protein